MSDISDNIYTEKKDYIIELSANVDDMTAEELGFAFEKLLEAGAVDVSAVPAVMKKNRPGHILNVLCKEDKRDTVVKAMFKHTRTIGVREKLMERYVLEREENKIDTPLGSVGIKTVSGYGEIRSKLEFDDLSRIASEHDMSIREVTEYIDRIRFK